jgi:hypothetical protein
MATRRDPTNKTLSENITWLDYCKQSNVYFTKTNLELFLFINLSRVSDALQENISRYNENYFCTIEKVLLQSDKIRIHLSNLHRIQLHILLKIMAFTFLEIIESQFLIDSLQLKVKKIS